MLKNIYVTVAIVKEIKTRKTKFKTVLFITYFRNRLKVNNYKRKSHA